MKTEAKEFFEQGEMLFATANDDIQNFNNAVFNYQKAVELGHTVSMFRLGQLYEKGVNGHPDVKKAETWYRKAAEHDIMPAWSALGRILLNNNGNDKSL